MTEILDYLNRTHHPMATILYGSYADGTAGEGSDFDALLIVSEGEARHDTAEVAGVRLDVWVYPENHFGDHLDIHEILQIHDGVILQDTDGIARQLVERVQAYVASIPLPTLSEVQESLSWCRKMLRRAERADAEGLYRHHWLLTDSLQIACDILGVPYFGPKKALRLLQETYPDLYEFYTTALHVLDSTATERWIAALEAYTMCI